MPFWILQTLFILLVFVLVALLSPRFLGIVVISAVVVVVAVMLKKL